MQYISPNPILLQFGVKELIEGIKSQVKLKFMMPGKLCYKCEKMRGLHHVKLDL